MTQISGQQIREIWLAMQAAYTPSELAHMVRFCLDIELDSVANGENFADEIFSLIKWAEKNGQLRELLQHAQSYRPENEMLKAVATTVLGEWVTKPVSQSDAAQQIWLNSTKPQDMQSYFQAPVKLNYISGGNHLPKELPIVTDATLKIGRNREVCEIILLDERISRVHSIITFTNNKLYIWDAESSGGTFVNKIRLGKNDKPILKHLDVVHFNNVVYSVDFIPHNKSKSSLISRFFKRD